MPRNPDDVGPHAVSLSSRRVWLGGVLASAAPAFHLGAAQAAPASASTATRVSTLAALLRHNQELRPEFGGGFANHIPMVLYSLKSLGASDQELTRFADAQWDKMERLPEGPGLRVTADNWKQLLGRGEALNGFRALFREEVAQRGRDATLRRYLPGLLPGAGAGSFHALIRTGYGVRFGDPVEVAEGLAYWATTFIPLGPLPKAGSERDPSVVLSRISETRRLAGLRLSGRLIYDKMRAAAALPAFLPAVSELRPGDDTLPAIAHAMVRLYLLGGDFTALHAVTGTHAYRLLSPFVDRPDEGLRYFWQALVAAYISIGAPRLSEPRAADAPPWTASVQGALRSLDDHDVKLVDVAREEEAFYREPIYRRAAARRMRLV